MGFEFKLDPEVHAVKIVTGVKQNEEGGTLEQAIAIGAQYGVSEALITKHWNA